MRVTQHPILDDLDESKKVTLYYNGQPIEALEGEPIASALMNAGIRIFRTTAKKHEPRGIFCAIGRCTDCMMIVDGIPNTRTCVTKVKVTVQLQLCAAFMLGCFYAGGQIDAVMNFAQDLNSNVLKLGGSVAMMLIGMLTESQSTAQNVIFSFFGPALVNIGLNPTHVAIAGANLAASGQGLPPADLTTFVVAGIVGGMLGKKVDPLKSMIYMIPMCLLFAAIGITFLYI